ncbi:PorT family protein [Dysgonomonas sp. HDW5A]|uniref:porin family protein n=1 Tax=Dysgonomonas sp. HDW5A TaxID=2714926 RepID=UPI00140AB93B|nr:porin family protein [Dysgonomonas sp. HDW5A]QIK61524.1 PorT family protein [Dysgonomonas sp. HDW5A]
MKSLQYKLIVLMIVSSIFTLSSQEKTDNRFEHKIIAGFNIGATAPTSIPAEIRSIDAWWPQFTPQLGYNVTYKLNQKWGLGSGISLDYKGMGTRATVKYIYTSIVIEDGSNDALEGYFVGKNETVVKLAYATIPLYATFNINQSWQLRAGGYASYLFSGKFSGTASDGYIRVNEPTGEKVEITKASFDFNDKLRNFDFGLILGAERKINDRFGIYSNLNWGLTSIFPSDFRAIDFNMYNIYLTIGLTYKL